MDRYTIAEPIVYHLKNYGIDVWYDRFSLIMGDNRKEKNLYEGASKCKYSIIILSKNTMKSVCATEEIHILEKRHKKRKLTVFPVLYELSPNDIPQPFEWVKELIFKEVSRESGTREICNHIACKITDDIKSTSSIQNIQEIFNLDIGQIPQITRVLLQKYQSVDCKNLNSRITLLYAAYLTLYLNLRNHTPVTTLISKIFERLFSETRLNLSVDYRELWLLENSICILAEYYKVSCMESNI